MADDKGKNNVKNKDENKDNATNQAENKDNVTNQAENNLNVTNPAENEGSTENQFANVIIFQIPVMCVDFSVCEREFSNIQSDFNSDMQIIEVEMEKFQNALKNYLEASEAQAENGNPQDNPQENPQENPIMNDSPLIQKDGDKDILKLRFNIGNFESTEVDVKVNDGTLEIRAVHDETSGGKKTHQEYSYNFILPDGVTPDSIRTSFSQDGVLTVEAPLKSNEPPSS